MITIRLSSIFPRRFATKVRPYYLTLFVFGWKKLMLSLSFHLLRELIHGLMFGFGKLLLSPLHLPPPLVWYRHNHVRTKPVLITNTRDVE